MAARVTIPRNTQRAQQTFYADFETDFDLVNNRDIRAVTNETSILQALHSLIRTTPGERVYNPLFGCNLRDVLFEIVSPQAEQTIRDRITTSIENFEPRVQIISVDVVPSTDENAYIITLVFSVINKQEPITTELVLNRIR